MNLHLSRQHGPQRFSNLSRLHELRRTHDGQSTVVTSTRTPAKPFFRQALDAGINFFDTANVYSGRYERRDNGRDAVVNDLSRRTRDRDQALQSHCAKVPTAEDSRAKQS